jgi:DNA primase
MASLIETIKAKIDIVDEISTVVSLQKSGKALKGLCPFHNERTPSFYVNPEAQSWHCFGCNEGGDVFTFVEKQQNMDFREALVYLAEKASVPIDEYAEGNSEHIREMSAAKERLYKINEDALLWFHQSLLRSKEAAAAREYVQSRGISSESVIAFGIGYASEQWNALSNYLLGQGYTQQELVNAGLARWRENDSLGATREGIYDYFRHRLIFPIRDIRGHVIGFGGRALGGDKPKYLNSPQTVVFEKNTVLYALDLAKDTIKQAKQVIIVEGYVDAVIAHQYGTRQTVACIGSAITEKHIQVLKKLTRQVTLALDPDAAGSAATEQGIQEALKGFDRTIVPVPLAGGPMQRSGEQKGAQERSTRGKQPVRGIIRLEEQVDAEINVLQLPPGEDPDEVIQRDFSTWLYAVSHPLSLVDYYFSVKTTDLNLREPVGKTEAAKRLLPVIGMISDRIKRDAYLRKLSSMISIDERSLYEELQRVLRNQKSNGVTAHFSDQTSHHRERGPEKHDKEDLKPLSTETSSQKDVSSDQQTNRPAPGFRLDRAEQGRLKWEDYLIGLLLRNPGLSQHVYAIISEDDFAGTDTRALYHVLNSVYQHDSSTLYQPFDQFVQQVVPSALMPTVNRALERAEPTHANDDGLPVKEAVQCASRLKRNRLLQLNQELKFLLQEASVSGDKASVRQLQQQFVLIQQQLRTINTATHLQG